MSPLRTPVVGRDEEFSVLDAALHGVRPGRHTLVVVRGRAGAGKTTLLSHAQDNWEALGVRVVFVRFGEAGPDWDELGVHAMVSAVRDLAAGDGDPQLAAVAARVERLCRKEVCGSPQGRSLLPLAVARMFAQVSARTRTVVLADDVDALAFPALTLAPLCGPGQLVVASGNADEELEQLADEVIRLGPLAGDAVGDLLSRVGGSRADGDLIGAVQAALGPLAGDPDSLSATVRGLRDDDRLTVVNGRLCLSGDEPILLPAGTRLMARIGGLGPAAADLMVVVSGQAPFGIDDLPVLAAATDREVTDYGWAVDRLVEAGVLDCDQDGSLTCRSQALAGRLRADAGGRAAALHRAFAERILGSAALVSDASALAGHLALAGPEMPVTPALATFLVDQADRVAVADPARASDWYRPALRGLEPADQEGVLSRLAKLLLNTGRFAQVLELPAPRTPAAELAAAMAVAAVHTNRPLPSRIREVLPEAGSTWDRWVAGDGIGAADLLSWAEKLREDIPPPDATAADDLAEAAERWDLQTLSELLLGVGAQARHPPALYRRVLAGYASGAWEDALSAARSLELAGPVPGVVRVMARLLAAEMCAAQNRQWQAEAWLARGTERQETALWRAWVECGMRWRTGKPGEAFEWGWRALRSHGPKAGRSALLTRLTSLAFDRGRPEQAAAVLETGLDRTGAATYQDRYAELTARAAAGADGEAAASAADLARRRGHLPDLARACWLAGTYAADAQKWLYEAHDLVRSLGATALRAPLRETMRRRGVVAPRSRPRDLAPSETDTRVLELIRAGWTNRQIAGVLRVTEKAVEYHLSRLFTKTGCRTRMELAAEYGRLNAVGA